MWIGPQFSGAKIAVILGEELLVYRRDDKPEIPFPGQWDLPGGGREGDESPTECALRELMEEFGIVLAPARIIWIRQYEGHQHRAGVSYFLVAPITSEEIARIRFGSEGECWQMMAVTEFLSHPGATRHLQLRLSDYLRSVAEGRA